MGKRADQPTQCFHSYKEEKMKLQISMGQPDLMGYTNIDILKNAIDLGKLDNVCEAAECTHLIINDVLKFIAYEKIPLVLQHIESRLRHKSKLTLIFTDMNSVIRTYNTTETDEKLFNNLMFGNGFRSCFSYDYISRIIKALRLNILSTDISKEQVIIIIERP